MQADDQPVWKTICLISLTILVFFLALELMKAGSTPAARTHHGTSEMQPCQCICESDQP
jgi:hypothetical protein